MACFADALHEMHHGLVLGAEDVAGGHGGRGGIFAVVQCGCGGLFVQTWTEDQGVEEGAVASLDCSERYEGEICESEEWREREVEGGRDGEFGCEDVDAGWEVDVWSEGLEEGGESCGVHLAWLETDSL